MFFIYVQIFEKTFLKPDSKNRIMACLFSERRNILLHTTRLIVISNNNNPLFTYRSVINTSKTKLCYQAKNSQQFLCVSHTVFFKHADNFSQEPVIMSIVNFEAFVWTLGLFSLLENEEVAWKRVANASREYLNK